MPHARRRAFLVALALALPACRRAGCSGDTAPPEPSSNEPAPPPLRSLTPRCVREVTHAAVFVPPGAGAIDTVVPACARGTLAVFTVRGHTLARTERPTEAGAGFGAPLVVATGADRLGPVPADGVDGPLAWRSPLAGVDPDERDDVWAAELTRGDAGVRVLRGDALMPAGVVGLGLVTAVERTAAGLAVYASFARPGERPVTSRVRVALGREEPVVVAELAAELPGELRAWESTRRVALARVEDASGGASLEATWPGGARARHQLEARHALVVARGVAVGGRSAFLVGEFALGRDDAGGCVTVGEGMCVRAGALYLLLAGEPGAALERVDVARAGLPDSVAARGGEVTALYLAPEETALRELRPAQRAARVDVARREVAPLTLAPPEGFGAIDGPALVACDDGVWLAAEVALGGGAAGRRAVTALPLECVAR